MVFGARYSRDVMRLDGAQGKNLVRHTYVRTWSLVEANVLYFRTCDIVGTFRRPCSDRRPWNCAPLPSLVTTLRYSAITHLCKWPKVTLQFALHYFFSCANQRFHPTVKVLWSLLKPKKPHLGTTVNLLHGSDSWLVPRTMFTSRCSFDLPKASGMLVNSV